MSILLECICNNNIYWIQGVCRAKLSIIFSPTQEYFHSTLAKNAMVILMIIIIKEALEIYNCDLQNHESLAQRDFPCIYTVLHEHLITL